MSTDLQVQKSFKRNKTNILCISFRLIFLAFILPGLLTKPASAQEKLESKGHIPILGWYSIPPEEATTARYLEMKEAGFDISFSFLRSPQDVQKSLDAAHQAGMKIVISCPELKTETEKIVKQFMSHPALAGYFLRDEPAVDAFADLGNWAKKVNAVDPKHFCYVNLFPNYATPLQLGTADYREYVNKFAKEVPLNFLSFDSYPLTSAEGVYEKWHQNLEIFSDEAKKVDKPFWGFAQSVLFDNKHEDPTLATMRVQMFTNLAYGAQGLQYFTYWTPVSSAEDFRGGPITLEGKRSTVYDNIKTLNQEIKSLAGVFYGAKVKSLQFFGNVIPAGTKRMSVLPAPIRVFATEGKTVLVSFMENGGKQFIVIVNTDYRKKMSLTLTGDSSLKRVLKDGSIVPASAYANTIDVEAGDLVIYTY
ncbi:beta-galactosidase [Daejeonella sp.]|uniref:beta-galactosidase n=1 Tax=Daejeonella sp. TaxID=2805397 RepID=UPI00268C6B93|nr:beta-galactosidase [Daejeonella sp.]HQT23211.1 beta-galactosidase [Daejeonella sp.]HQT58163.1 beta-galactosidase [Daejeonella sp.]